MIDWTVGYECEYRYCMVDEKTWATGTSLANATDASYSAETSTDGVETGTLSQILEYQAEKTSGWVRIQASLTQGVSSEFVQIGTLFFTPESCTWSGGMRRDSLRGVSALGQASKSEALKDGTFAAKGADGAYEAAKLIQACTVAPVITHGSIALPESVVYDLDSDPLSAANTVLETAGWIARPDELGQVHIMAKPTAPIASFGASEKGLFLSTASSDSEGKITYTRAWAPEMRVWDIFTANLPEIGLNGTYRVVSQRVTCGRRIVVSETVEEVL